MDFSYDNELQRCPTINSLNYHIDLDKKELEEINEFYKESYSILESYRDEYYKFAKDMKKREIWTKFCERQTAGFLEANKKKKKNSIYF